MIVCFMPYIYVDIKDLQLNQDSLSSSVDLRPLLYTHPEYKRSVLESLPKLLE